MIIFAEDLWLTDSWLIAGFLVKKPRNSHFVGEKTDKALAIGGGLSAYSLRANV